MLQAALLRLMSYQSLSRNVRLGPEDMVALDFATRMRVATIEGRLKAVWFHPANELANGHRTGIPGAIARALGMHRGVVDYVFLGRARSIALEAKSAKGPQSPIQKDFEAWCAANGVPYRIFRTAGEGEAILREEGLLL